MKSEKRNVWGFNGTKWVKVDSVKIPDYDSETATVYVDQLKEYNKVNGFMNAYFPLGINPNKYGMINVMRETMERHTKSYKEDFYYFDIPLYFKYNKDVVWILRECGTNIYSLSEYESERLKEISIYGYTYYTTQERSGNKVFKVDHDSLHPIKLDKGLTLIQNAPVKVVEAC